jgi:hypothetical protein
MKETNLNIGANHFLWIQPILSFTNLAIYGTPKKKNQVIRIYYTSTTNAEYYVFNIIDVK